MKQQIVTESHKLKLVLTRLFADLVEENRKTNEVKSALNVQDITYLLTLLWCNNIFEIMN